MKLTYWKAPMLNDANCYSIRAKTKKECKRLVEESGYDHGYGEVEKVVVEYKDAFDLMDTLVGSEFGSRY